MRMRSTEQLDSGWWCMCACYLTETDIVNIHRDVALDSNDMFCSFFVVSLSLLLSLVLVVRVSLGVFDACKCNQFICQCGCRHRRPRHEGRHHMRV